MSTEEKGQIRWGVRFINQFLECTENKGQTGGVFDEIYV